VASHEKSHDTLPLQFTCIVKDKKIPHKVTRFEMDVFAVLNQNFIALLFRVVKVWFNDAGTSRT
jgi:hypothetical protein